jgi:hypothetical protein
VKLSTLDDSECVALEKWIAQALDAQQPIQLHVVGQGWELRCYGIDAFFFSPDYSPDPGRRPPPPEPDDPGPLAPPEPERSP